MVLSRDYDKRLRQVVGNAVNSDMALLHSLKQRGLGFARSTVDFIRKQQVRHNRAGLVLKLSALFIINGKADYVGRHGVGSELHALVIKPENFGKSHCHGGLAHSGNVLHKYMTLGKNRHKNLFDDIVLTDNYFFNFTLNLHSKFVHFSVSLNLGEVV